MATTPRSKHQLPSITKPRKRVLFKNDSTDYWIDYFCRLGMAFVKEHVKTNQHLLQHLLRQIQHLWCPDNAVQADPHKQVLPSTGTTLSLTVDETGQALVLATVLRLVVKSLQVISVQLLLKSLAYKI